ncbi:MAG: DUF4422 domain-containing protein [Lachnospiraceae bacterium]|nr:DUF4422 domain-containing protein [Lachnospiraceae bacterium]
MADSLRIIVAAHKSYPMPEDPAYLPIQVGAAGKQSIGFARDDEGDNISDKNNSYCELTGLYYAWKNLDAKALGLVHYRRHFAAPIGEENEEIAVGDRRIGGILKGSTAEKLLEEADVIVPRKRRYFIESLFSHYGNTLDHNHLVMVREIIAKRDPEIIPVLDQVYSRTWGYMFNMFIMPAGLVSDYCGWLFPLLEELEGMLPEAKNAFEGRVCGRVSEILFNVWLENKKKTGIRIRELGIIYTEPVNWPKKIKAFLAAKFRGVKYKESF